ncbi:MAG TPA: type VI secretion system tube protein Hcp [Limnobacter sp.]|nr:type VI secretion system tube protein Hcp [Limnobacter sp.]
MRADIFLKLPAIRGESIDQKHLGEIEIQMVEWTMSLPANTSGRGGVGRAEVGELILRKQVDSSTPVLHAHCCSGTAMPEAVLVKRKSGTVPLEYYKLTMKEVLVSHVYYSMGGPSDADHEIFHLRFAEYIEEYTPQNTDGTGAAAVRQGFNLLKNIRL